MVDSAGMIEAEPDHRTFGVDLDRIGQTNMSNNRKPTAGRQKATLKLTQADVDQVGAVETQMLQNHVLQSQLEYLERRVILLRTELDLVYNHLKKKNIHIDVKVSAPKSDKEAEGDESED